jgi:pyruvate,water dikinase
VLVQQLVLADASAVVFSAHPCSGDTQVVWVNAAFGLGESLVGGAVTPDLYGIRKVDLTIMYYQVTEKTCLTVAGPGGTSQVPLPHSLRHERVLGDGQLKALAILACQLETELGFPVDLECAFRGEKLYLLQCRPITTLVNMPAAISVGW